MSIEFNISWWMIVPFLWTVFMITGIMASIKTEDKEIAIAALFIWFFAMATSLLSAMLP